jgi:hypothetical protein
MAMWRKYKYKKVDFKESSQLSQELICLQMARLNYRKNYATIERIYISIKKNYGDDVPKLPSAQKDSGKKNSAKTESISDKMENLSMDITDIETETEPKDSENLKDTESSDLRDLYRDDTTAQNHSYTKEGYRIDDFVSESSINGTGSIPSRLFQYFDGDEHSELTESVKDYNFHPANKMSSIARGFQKRNEELKQAKKDGIILQDLYETQEQDIAIIVPIIEKFKSKVLFDPCCGNSAYKNALKKYDFHNIIERDLYTTEIKHDFLTETIPKCDLILGNPPFNFKHQFLEKAYTSGIAFCFLLPCLNVLDNTATNLLLEKYGCRIYIISPKCQFLHNGQLVTPHICAYFVHEPSDTSDIKIFYLRK